MIKSAFGLGVLSIPFVFQAVGIVPGIILIVVIELIVTWSAFVLGSFKLNHRECYSLADVGRILAGRWGEEFFTLAVCICKWSLGLAAASDVSSCQVTSCDKAL